LLLAVQVIGLWFTQGRGSFVGLLGGMLTLVVMYLLLRGARRVAFGVLGATLALLACLAFLSSDAVASSLRDPYMKRLARTFSTEGGTTAQVRTLIWDGALRLALPHAPLWSPTTGDDRLNMFRPLVGYGPESMYAAYNQFYPPELARVEVRTAKPDRAHNETLDSLVQLGLLGAAGYLLVFSSLCYWSCKWLGLIVTSRDRIAFITLWLAGGMLISLIVCSAFGWHFVGVALPAGMLVGFFVYLCAFARFPESAKIEPASHLNRSPFRNGLLVTLIAALIGHWLEIQFGVAFTATRTYFWFFAALLIAIGVRQLPEFEPTQAANTTDRVRVSTAPLIVFGLFTGLVLAILAFAFVSPQPALAATVEGAHVLDGIVVSLTSKNTTEGLRPSLAILWLLAGTMLLALAIGVAEWARGLKLQFAEWLLAIGLFLLTAHAILSAFIFYHTFLIGMSDPDTLGVLISTFSYFVLFVIALVLVSAISLVFEHPLPQVALARRWSWLTVPAASISGLVLIATTNVSTVQADIIYKQAPRASLDHQGAITSFQHALAIQPTSAYAFVFLGDAYLTQARELTDPAHQNELLGRAEAALLRAREIDPFDSDHTVLLAQLHETWAALTVIPSQKDDHFRKALAYYAQATRLSPNAAHLNDQYAQALLEAAAFLEQQQDSSGAGEARRNLREQLARALALDPTFCLTFAIRADTQSTWTDMAHDALDALTYVPRCHIHRDPFEQQARLLALRSLSTAGERANAVGEGAAFASLLEAEARAHPSVDLYMTLADYYAKGGAIEAATQAAEAGLAFIPANDQATRQKYASWADSLGMLRDSGRDRIRPLETDR
jgi:tetratricopeptide (TPR) repeat protein